MFRIGGYPLGGRQIKKPQVTLLISSSGRLIPIRLTRTKLDGNVSSYLVTKFFSIKIRDSKREQNFYLMLL